MDLLFHQVPDKICGNEIEKNNKETHTPWWWWWRHGREKKKQKTMKWWMKGFKVDYFLLYPVATRHGAAVKELNRCSFNDTY